MPYNQNNTVGARHAYMVTDNKLATCIKEEHKDTGKLLRGPTIDAEN